MLVVVLVTGIVEKVLVGGDITVFGIRVFTGGRGCTECGMRCGVAGGMYLGVGTMGTCMGGGLREGEAMPGVRGRCGGERHWVL